MLWEKTSGRAARTMASASGAPLKSGVRTSTEHDGFASRTAPITWAKWRAPSRSSSRCDLRGDPFEEAGGETVDRLLDFDGAAEQTRQTRHPSPSDTARNDEIEQR